MYLGASVIATFFVLGVAVAQNGNDGSSSSSSSSGSSTNTSSFNSGAVSLTTKNQWCQGETANCPMLCGGTAFTKANSCSGNDLTYTCTCSNNSAPASIDQYLDTLPNHICQETFAQCNRANPGSSQCKTCGTLKAQDVPSSTSSAVASATSTDSSSSSAAATSSPSSNSKSDASKLVVGAGLSGAIILGAVML